MKKKRKYNLFEKNSLIFYIVIFLLTMFLGIGYAQISDIDLIVSGTATASPTKDVIITDIEYISGNIVNPNNQDIDDPYLTLMTSKIELGNDLTSSITYKIKIRNNSDKSEKYDKPVYSTDLGYDNEDIEFIINGISHGDVIQANEEKEFTITFKYSDSLSSITNQILHSIINFKFIDSISIIEFAPSGVCEFHGQGNDIIGDCANGQHIDYIDTGISLFNSENHDKDFEIGFTVDNIDNSRFRSGKVDTIFDCLYDNSPYPGVAFRIENSKWYLQVGTGSNNKKITWDSSAIQSFVLRKVNNKVYYSINGGSFVYVDNLASISTFDRPITFGTSYNGSGAVRPERFLIANLSNIYVRVYEQGTLEEPEPLEPEERTYDTIDQEILTFMEENMITAFVSNSQNVFDGTTENIIDTGVELLNSTNYQKSFIVTFTIDEFVRTGQVNQATLFNIKDESNSSYPGLMMRLNNNQFELAMKDGIGTSSSVNIPLTANRINIIKKGMQMYYQVDLGEIKPLGNTNNFENYPVSNTFNIPATFGCNINGSGNYDRMVIGKMSNMIIKVSAS